MNKKIINNLSKIIVTLIISFLVIGCSSNGDTDTASNLEVNTKPTGKKVTFVSWLSEEKELDQKVLDAYHKIHPDADIEFKYVGDNKTANYYQQVDLMLMGGEDVDIVMTSAYAEHAQRASSGIYLPLDKFFEEEGVEPKQIYNEKFIAPVNNHIYGIPGDVKNWIVYINKDKLKEAGLEEPPLDWTWEDFEQYAKKLTNKGTVGGYFHTWDHFNYLNIWSLRMGNPLIKEDGKLAFDDPKFKEFVQFRKKMEDEGVLLPYKTIKATQSTYRDRFFNGEIAMFPIATFLIPELDNVKAFPHDFQTTFASLPRDKDGKAGRTYAESLYYSISASSDAPKEAYDFIRFYTTEGAKIKGRNLPSINNADKMEYINKMVGDKKYVDMDQLEKVITNPEWEDNPNTTAPVYQKELSNMMVEETEKYYLGNKDIDEVIQNMMKRGEQIQNK